MIEVSVPKVSRRVAADLGAEHGIRPFHWMGLLHLERSEAIEVCEAATRRYKDSERRGEYVRRHAVNFVRRER